MVKHIRTVEMKYETYQYKDEEKEEYMDLLGERDETQFRC